MKRILLTIGVLFTSQSFAAAPTFCSSPTMAYQSGCTSTCAAVAAAVAAGDVVINNGAGGIPTNSYKSCEGKVTKKSISVYKIEMAKTTGDISRCTIWEGDDLTIELGGSSTASLASKYPINLTSCTVGVAYNTLLITTDTFEQFAAEAVFPDNSGSKVRTTSTYAAKDTGHSTATLATWRDVEFADSSLYYFTPGSATSAHKKLGISTSSTDLSGSTNVTMEWDLVKSFKAWATDTSTRSGWSCDPGDSIECSQEIDGNSDRYVSMIQTSDVTGFPLTLKESDDTFDLEYVRFASERGTNQYKGVEFVWYNNGGTLEYAGVETTDDGSYFVVSNVRSNEGL
jgi:hypothetical protein